MELIADLINSSEMIMQLINKVIPCQKVELHIKDFCSMLDALLSKEFDSDLLNSMKHQLTDGTIASASDRLAEIKGEGK